ncbi:hypothetical protein [Nocardia sp. NPDC050412]|uniref:hypothetical protein n=1 Tax=Nocardia sp. NPDC050412 TaxID=3364320 RepID=UPI00379877D1
MERDLLALLLPLLRRAGVDVAAGTEKDLLLKVPETGTVHLHLKVTRRRLSGKSVTVRRAGLGRRTLYVAPSATPDVVGAAAAGEFDLVTEQPEQVIIGGRVLLKPADPRHSAGHRRIGWGRQAILRVLALSSRPLQQSELAATVGISQQAVSLGLHRIPAEVVRNVQGWMALEGALDVWLDSYAGPGGTVSYWYGLDNPASQATTALQLLDELELQAVVSGDLAADKYAPWQLPGTVRLYLPEIVDFTPVGFSPATPDDATMTVAVPEDPTVVHIAAALGARYGDRHLLADAAITLWDLLNTSTTPTTEEAATRLRAAIETGAFGV